MSRKRLSIAPIIAAAGLCVCVVALTFLLWTRAGDNRDHAGAEPAGRAQNDAATHPAKKEAGARVDAAREKADEPAVPPDVSRTDSPDESSLPLPEHDPLAVRIALERMKRPDLKNRPSGPERIKAHHKTLQIPEEELVTLPTDRLLAKVVSTPFIFEMMLEPYADGGLARFARSYNGVDAFLNRPDAAEVLMREYTRLSDTIAAARTPDPYYLKLKELMSSPPSEALYQYVREAPWEKDVFCFTVMEVLMTSAQVMGRMKDADQRRQVVSSLVKCLDAKERFNAIYPEPVYGKGTLEYSALALARYLAALDAPDYRSWYAVKRTEGLFIDRLATREEAEDIIAMARRYLGQPPGT